MTYFLCLAIPQAAVPRLRKAFDPIIHLGDVTATPFGIATIGKPTRGKTVSWSEYQRGNHIAKDAPWAAYFLQISFGSAILIGKGAARKTHNNHRPELLVEGIQSLMADETCPLLALMYHWIPNDFETEPVAVHHVEEVKESDIDDWISRLEEDVRYVVSK